MSNERVCYNCRIPKPFTPEFFYRDNSKPSGLQYQCKKCHNKWRGARKPSGYNRPYSAAHGWKKRYGMTKEEYVQKLASQNGLCALCKQPPEQNEYLAVDHTHTGIKCQKKDLRGLIHRTCNSAIGFLKDSPAICRMAADYLERFASRV